MKCTAKTILVMALMVALSTLGFGQGDELDSLLRLLPATSEPRSRIDLLQSLCVQYLKIDNKKSEQFALEALSLATKHGEPADLADIHWALGATYGVQGSLDKAFSHLTTSEQIFKKLNQREGLAKVYNTRAVTLGSTGKYIESIQLLLVALKINREIGNKANEIRNITNLGVQYGMINDDSMAILYYKQALAVLEKNQVRNHDGILANITENIADVYVKTGKYKDARPYISASMKLSHQTGDVHGLAANYKHLALISMANHHYDSALFYLQRSRFYGSQVANELHASYCDILVSEIAYHRGDYLQAIGIASRCVRDALNKSWLANTEAASRNLSRSYSKIGRYDSAFKYQQIYLEAKDTLYNLEKAMRLMSAQTTAAINQKDLENQLLEHKSDKQQLTMILLTLCLSLVAVLSYLISSAYKKERSARMELDKKNALIEAQNSLLNEKIDELRKTQVRLIQSEKMASLGTLTAGIAHEINNPINFISSGIDTLEEIMKDLKKHSDGNEAQSYEDIDVLLSSIKTGVIRSKDIVTGLRGFTGAGATLNENVDLLDCLYYTLTILNNKIRFGVNIVRDIQPVPTIRGNTGQINQVLLNVIDNAIYATELSSRSQEIVIRTSSDQTHVYLSIADNGPGIPAAIQARVFDPFFTTKGVGKGTGLGLSISYAIIKTHRGEIAFETGNNGTTFTIKLPIG